MRSLSFYAVTLTIPLVIVALGGIVILKAGKSALKSMSPSNSTNATTAKKSLITLKMARSSIQVIPIGFESINLNDTKDPLVLFQEWRQQAKNNPLLNQHIKDSAIVGTIDEEGHNRLDVVMSPQNCGEGFKFFTSQNSPLAKNSGQNPNVTSVFISTIKKSDGTLGNRQVKLYGTAEVISPAESQIFFKNEPTMSKLRILLSNEENDANQDADERISRFLKNYFDGKLKVDMRTPAPKSLGGFIVKPHKIEFYQSSKNCLGERIQFTKRIMRDMSEFALPDGYHEGENGWIYIHKVY